MPLPIFTPWISGAHLPAGSRPVDHIDFPYTGEPAADVVQATDSDLDQAIEAAHFIGDVLNRPTPGMVSRAPKWPST